MRELGELRCARFDALWGFVPSPGMLQMCPNLPPTNNYDKQDTKLPDGPRQIIYKM